MIPVYRPYLPPKSLEYAHEALDSTWISSQGKYMELATEELKQHLDVKHALLCANGTVANHLMAKCLRLRTTKKNVIVPSNAYVAAWNPFLYDGFFRLMPVDMNLDTWNAELTDRLHSAENLLVVHNLGNIQNVPRIAEKYPHLNIVEDACEAFGGSYWNVNEKSRMAGTAAMCSTLSFYANKNITSGEGGAFVTNDDELYTYARLIWGQGQSEKKFVHTDLGYNYRMTNVQAAILYGQLQLFDEIFDRKDSIWEHYFDELSHVSGIQLQQSEPGVLISSWMFGVRFLGNPAYETAESYFKNIGIETRPFFYTINKHKHLWGIEKFPNGEILEREVVVFPSYPDLTKEQVAEIIKGIKVYASYNQSRIR